MTISKKTIETLEELAQAIDQYKEELLIKLKNRTITEEEFLIVLALLGCYKEDDEW